MSCQCAAKFRLSTVSCWGAKMVARCGLQLAVIFSLISIGLTNQTNPVTTLLSWIDTFQGGGSAVARRLLFEYLPQTLRGGDSFEEFIPTIIGGYPVENRRDLPFMARLSLCSQSDPSNCYHICGAVIIGRRHLLSAGHCMFYPSTRSLLQGVQATMGDLQIYSLETNEVQMRVALRPHPDYDNIDFYRHDVGVAILERELVFGPRIASLRLPTTVLNITHRTGQIPGWGRFSSTPGDNRVSSNLQMVDLLVLTLEECRQTYEDKVTAAHVCYGGFNSTGGICNGDSGGPVYIFLSDTDTVGTVIAVNSFIRRTPTNDCPTDKPGVGTRISYYLDFLNSELNATISPTLFDDSQQPESNATDQKSIVSWLKPFRRQASRSPPGGRPGGSTGGSSGSKPVVNNEQDSAQNTESNIFGKTVKFAEDFFTEARMWLLPDHYGFHGRFVRNGIMFDD